MVGPVVGLALMAAAPALLDRAIAAAGGVQPPDHAVETQELGRGPGSRRRMILAADKGWSQREGRRNRRRRT